MKGRTKELYMSQGARERELRSRGGGGGGGGGEGGRAQGRSLVDDEGEESLEGD